MKVIISPLQALDHYVSREFSFIIRELLQTFGWYHADVWKLHSVPGPLPDKLKREFGLLPEVILIWGAGVVRH